MTISDTKVCIYVPATWWKTKYHELRYEDINKDSKFFYKFEGEGLLYEIVESVKNNREKKHGNIFLTADDMLMESRILRSYNKAKQNYYTF